ncbi:MAG: hypothetical protein KJZ79_02595 [Bryobacteraceae bacterium]|nr:hypothetical protein [Solibacteraceae bacterium]MCL4840698.1 hypothetical protein [Bryobacteraceae bacterium]
MQIPGSISDPAALTRAALEHDPSVIYFLDRHLRINWCNAAWDRFARENRGPHLIRQQTIGFPILNAFPDTLVQFYASMYESVLATGVPVSHEFECSSDTLFRRIHLFVLSNPTELGLILINSPIVEHPHGPERPAHQPPGGLDPVPICCHCRRTRLSSDPPEWVWVPGFVREPPPRVSHMICNPCHTLNYPEFLPRRARLP